MTGGNCDFQKSTGALESGVETNHLIIRLWNTATFVLQGRMFDPVNTHSDCKRSETVAVSACCYSASFSVTSECMNKQT